MKIKSNYDANFTAGGILFNEFISLEDMLLSENFVERICIEEEENNVMGVATNSARKRIISEIKRRYNVVPNDFWILFFGWNENEQKLALFFLCLKTYPLIFDIHFEVTLKKFKVGSSLNAYDIQMQIDEIASSDDGVASWSVSTLKKMNVQYRKALKDVGLWNGERFLEATNTSSQFWNYFEDHHEAWFLSACFKN
jgi:hypothetical protein